MNFEFSETSVIIIPFVHKNCRLDDGEKVRFRCLFKNVEGDFPYTLDIEEDNKGEKGADGKYTISIDTATKGILPGRYQFDLSLVLASGSLITLKTKDECCIEIIPAAEGLYKPNGDIYFGADYIVEQGQHDLWTYRKWASGVAECWGEFGHWGEKVSNQKIRVLDYNRAFPFAFTADPNVTAGVSQKSVKRDDATGGPMEGEYVEYMIIRASASKTHLEEIALLGFSQTEERIFEGSCSVSVKGRWK